MKAIDIDEMLSQSVAGDSWQKLILDWRYVLGDGIPQSETEATRWFRKAAELGLAEAQHDLGGCYAEGYGVAQSWEKAAHWFRLAAAQGDATAQFKLGMCCEHGHGVPQSWREALEWFRQAAGQGHEDAQSALATYYRTGCDPTGASLRWNS